jgi:hypothetical protein
MVINENWRSDLRRYLRTVIGKPVFVGDLYAEIGRTIPLHHATRIWSRRGKELGSFDQMRFACLVHTLALYYLKWDPPTRQSHPITEDHMFIALGTVCPNCGTVFVRQKNGRRCKTYACSTTCARKLRFNPTVEAKKEPPREAGADPWEENVRSDATSSV